MPKNVIRMAKSGESESYAIKDTGARSLISNEVTAREAAVSGEATARAAAVSGEATARAAADTVLTEKTRIACAGSYVYFSNGSEPTIETSGSYASASAVVTLPNSEFRLYDYDGTVLMNNSTLKNTSYTVNSFEKLVLDYVNQTVTVKATTEESGAHCVDLLVMCGQTIAGGALAPYYFKTIRRIIDDKSADIGLTPYFSNNQKVAFVKTGSGSSTSLEIIFPNADFRVYKTNGSALVNIPVRTATHLFTLTNLEKLVLNLSTNEISKIATTAGTDRMLVLASLSDGVVSGLLADFYYEQGVKNQEEQNGMLNAVKDAEVRFLFFSDIHGRHYNMDAIRMYINGNGQYLDAVINAGDTVEEVITDGVDDYDDYVVNPSSIDVLTCVGNHDTWVSASTWEKANKAVVYEKLIQPMLDKQVPIVQPSGAATTKALYYYIDYGSVRVIVLDAMVLTGDNDPIGWWDSDEETWLASVLADAKTAGKSVMCVAHPPFEKSISVRDNDLKLNSYIDYRTSLNPSFDNIHLPIVAMDAVDAFISGGGNFIAWFTGHTHVDSVLTATGYTGQFMISIASANSNMHPDATMVYPEFQTDYWFNCFNIIGVDTDRGFIKVRRIGMDTDASMRKRAMFCYDYINRKFISE